MRPEFWEFQCKLVEHIKKLYESVCSCELEDETTEYPVALRKRAQRFASQGERAIPLVLYKQKATSLFHDLAKIMGSRGSRDKYCHTVQATRPETEPFVLICIDHPCELLDRSQFIAFQAALRYKRERYPLFGLLVDSSSWIVSSSGPSLDVERSFSPIYEVNSFDVFAIEKAQGWKDLKALARTDNTEGELHHLYTVGRPLWAAIFEEKCHKTGPREAHMDVLDLARRAICGTATDPKMELVEGIQDLALVSHRMELNVTYNQRISGTLVAEYMRSIMSIDKISFMQTYQASEPVLELPSQAEMSGKSKAPLEIVKSVCRHVSRQYVFMTTTSDIIAALILMFTVDGAQPTGTHRPLKLARFSLRCSHTMWSRQSVDDWKSVMAYELCGKKERYFSTISCD